MTARLSRSLIRVAAAGLFVAVATFTLRPTVRASHRAHLSDDLLLHEAHRTTARKRVIVTGDPAEIASIAARHQLQVVRLLSNGVVLLASSGELTDLSSDADVASVSVNVRVFGADGTGVVSDVIAGIDWVIANRTRYNIRVINLSLGHPVTEPAALDPMDQAVARAVEAGIIVVVAAGNDGVAANGAPILGGITVPGNSPLAITVGALNTWGTVDRSD